jgi:hypothetical protein
MVVECAGHKSDIGKGKHYRIYIIERSDYDAKSDALYESGEVDLLSRKEYLRAFFRTFHKSLPPGTFLGRHGGDQFSRVFYETVMPGRVEYCT